MSDLVGNPEVLSPLVYAMKEIRRLVADRVSDYIINYFALCLLNTEKEKSLRHYVNNKLLYSLKPSELNSAIAK